MIVLDTNVISELTKASPDANVLTWLDGLVASEVATTAVTVAELRYGVARLPDGRRKTQLLGAIEALITQDLDNRVEPFDHPAAREYATVVADRERIGNPIMVADAEVAAICRARGARLATRNIKDFVDTGIELVDPWAHLL